MTVVRVTRDQIIQAIEKEPLKTLRAGAWVSDTWNASGERKVSSKACTVCAVGAVMRNVVLAKDQPAINIQNAAVEATQNGNSCASDGKSIADVRKAALEELKEAPMSALSTFFEGMWEYYSQRGGWEVLGWHGGQRFKIMDFYLNHEDTKIKKQVAAAKKLLKNKKEMKEREKFAGLTLAEIEQVRDKCASFVRANFPKSIEVDIDGAKPARDVVVIPSTDED